MDQNERTEFLGLLAQFYAVIPCSEESGIRTPQHNKDIGGALDSAHVQGLAQDLILDTEINLESALYHAKALGFYGIEWDARNRHLHLDRHHSLRKWHVMIDTHGVSHALETSLDTSVT